MTDILFWIALAVATLATLFGKMLVNLAVGYVQTDYPEEFEALAAKNRSLFKGLSQPAGRVRRALAGKMLWGGLPETLAADPQIRRLQSHWRLLFAATVVGLFCVGIIIASRMPG